MSTSTNSELNQWLEMLRSPNINDRLVAVKNLQSRNPIFGSGGGEQLAKELQAPLLGQIPIDPHICSGGDSGNPIAISEDASPAKEVFIKIAAALNFTFNV